MQASNKRRSLIVAGSGRQVKSINAPVFIRGYTVRYICNLHVNCMFVRSEK